MKRAIKTTGLRYWMLRVLHECDHVAAGFNADPVHDLRVALRRCRSMADGMMAMDPDPAWKNMKKAGKRLFQSLGDLRDTQIMMEWIEKLSPTVSYPNTPPSGVVQASVAEADLPASPEANENDLATSSDPSNESSQDPAKKLLGILRSRESDQKRSARAQLDQFDRKQWRQWSKSLPVRSARIRPGSAVFKHLALERWTAARELHNRALRNRSQVALHALRIGIKRFRYIVENFLPVEHKLWSNDLKHMQDLLGEVHDLDVLWAAALSCHVFHTAESRRAWHERIVAERTKRIDEYRQRMVGPNSLWNVWRAGLPQGRRIQQIATQRMKLWAKALDPDFAHSECVARLAVELYDGLDAAALLGSSSEVIDGNGRDPRSALYVAALLHDVGRSKGNKGHHKQSQDLIKAHGTPLGWDADTMQQAAVIARFHSGALPVRSHKALRDLLPDQQKTIIRLAAILRLANAFDAQHDGQIRRVKVESQARGNASTKGRNGVQRRLAPPAQNQAVVVEAEGYIPSSSTAQRIAAERYLLETVLRRPVVVKAPSPKSDSTRTRLPARVPRN